MLKHTALFFTYLTLRLNCLKQQLQALLQQLQQLLVWLVVLLGPAALGLVLMILLLVGQLYSPKLSVTQFLLVCWCLLAMQSLLVWLCQTAILQPRYGLFWQSLPYSAASHKIAELLLLSCCLPIFWLHILIVANANFSQWQSVLPQLAFLSLQLTSAILVLYRPQRSVLALLLALPVVFYSPSAWYGLVLLSLAIGIMPLIPVTAKPKGFRVQGSLTLWLALIAQHPAQWLSRILLLGLITLLGQITLGQRQDLALPVHTTCAAVLMLISSSMQVNNNRLYQHYHLFFQQFAQHIQYWQYLAPLSLAIISLALLLYLKATIGLLLLASLLFLPCLFIAKKHPKQLVPLWFIASVILAYLSWLIVRLI